jgi:hypothetical protein
MLSSGSPVRATLALRAIVELPCCSRKIIDDSVDGCLRDDAYHRPSYNVSRVVRPTGDLNEGDCGRPGISGGAGLRIGPTQSSGDCNASCGVA